MLDTHKLKVFLAVWDTGSFSRAAELIHLTQPTVSGHVKALEDYLGVSLFSRTGKDVIPTKAGRLLYPRARQILNLTAGAEREMAMFLGLEKGRLDTGGSNVPGQYILPGLIPVFKAGRQDIKITVRIGDTLSITENVAEGTIEIGIVGAIIKSKGLDFTPCFRDELVLAISKDHRFAKMEQVSMEQLYNEPFIVREKGSGTRKTLERALEKGSSATFTHLKIVAELGSAEAVRQAVKAGAGCAILSRRVVQDDINNGTLSSPAIYDVDLSRQFYLVTDKRTALSPLAESFKDFLLSQKKNDITF